MKEMKTITREKITFLFSDTRYIYLWIYINFSIFPSTQNKLVFQNLQFFFKKIKINLHISKDTPKI